MATNNVKVSKISSPAEAIELCLLAWAAGLVPVLFGSNGVGKTTILNGLFELIKEMIRADEKKRREENNEQVVEAVVNRYNYNCQGLVPEDQDGYCYAIDCPVTPETPDGKKMVKLPLSRIMPNNPYECGLWMFDELDRSDIRVQNNLQKLFLDRELGSYKIPAGIHLIGAMNGALDRGTTPMTNGLKERLVFIYVGICNAWYDSYDQYAASRGGIYAKMAKYNRANPFKVIEMDDMALDSPRGRDRGCELFQIGKERGVRDSIIETAMRGACGQVRGASLFAYLNSPSIDELVAMSREDLAKIDPSIIRDVVQRDKEQITGSAFKALLARLPKEVASQI